MAPRKDEQLFKRNSKVVAVTDLPDVPAGTAGKVTIVCGISWIRYHVLFENGVERSAVRTEWLATREAYEKQQNEARREAYRSQRKAEREQALIASGAATEF